MEMAINESGGLLMNKRIYLSSPHMSDEGYEQAYVQEAFDTNWIAPLGANVNGFENELRIAEYVFTAIFTIEYLLRLST